MRLWKLATMVAGLMFAALNAQAQVEGAAHLDYYIGVDNREIVATGAYAGLANPNYNRLTFLVGFQFPDVPSNSHYHSIGAYSYTGPASAPTIVPTSTNNRLPELFNRPQVPLLALKPGMGAHSGYLMSGLAGQEDYEGFQIKSTDLLRNTGDHVRDSLFNSSGGRWARSIAGAQVGLELLSITDGFHVGGEAGESWFAQVGDIYDLGEGANLSVNPVFWTDAMTDKTVFEATFRLVDLGTGGSPFGASGQFGFDFTSVPEPGSVALLVGCGVAGVGILRRRRTLRR